MASQGKRRQRQAAAVTRPSTRHKRSGFSLDSEDSMRSLLIGATALIVLLAVGFIAYGYYDSVIKPRGRTVMAVEGVKVSYSDMKRRLRYEFNENPSYQQPNSVQLLPAIAYQNLLEELTLTERAESEMGVTATEEEIATKLRQKAGVPDTASDEEFGDRYRTVLSSSGLHDDEYRRVVEAEVLEEKVKAKLNESVPAEVPQAKVEVIAAPDEAAALAARERVVNGEDWATVAKEVSIEADVATTGGAKDYIPEGSLPAAYNDFAFSATPGEISDVRIDPSLDMTNATAFYVVRVVDRVNRPLTEEQRPSYEARQYDKWLTDTQAKMSIVDNWSDDPQAQADAITPLIEDAVERQRELQEQQNQQPPVQQPPAVATVALPDSTAAAGETPVAESTPAALPTAASGQ